MNRSMKHPARWALAATIATVGILVPAAPAHAATHKSPFDCGKTFYANNWSPGHSPSGSLDWQNYGSDAINGENVRATAAGTAYFYNAGSTSYGRWVEIVHSDGTKTRYAHLATQVRLPGQSMPVSQGTVIGTVGSTGGSSAPHLHYEQRSSGGTVDTSPTVDGVTISLGQKKAVTSSNACVAAWTQTVDNATSGRFTASANWGTSTYSAERYGADYRYASPITESDSAWYKFDIPATDQYKVDVWYPALPGYSSAAPHVIVTSSGSQTVIVDQRVNGGGWVTLGTFTLAAGDYNAVAVSRWTAGTGLVIADAVRLTQV